MLSSDAHTFLTKCIQFRTVHRPGTYTFIELQTRTRWKSIPYSEVKEHPFSLYGDMIFYFHIHLIQWGSVKLFTETNVCVTLLHQWSISFIQQKMDLYTLPRCLYCSLFHVYSLNVQSNIFNIVTRLCTAWSGFTSQ